MAIIKWTHPFEEMDRWFDDFGPLGWPQGRFNLTPAVDVYEDDKNVFVEAPLPGVDIANVKVSIENDVLTIESQSERKTEVDEKNYYRQEVRAGAFHRAVALPRAVDGDKAKASYENGMLKVAVPKKPEEVKKAKTIKVAVKNK